jgi:serine/threonine protein kinase
MRQIAYEDNTPIPASYHYKAPEEILPSSDTCSNVSSKGDVYSLASVAYEVFSGKQPYRGLHASCAVLKIVRNGHRTLQRPSNITSQLWAIMLNCWAFKPDDRPSALKVSSALKGIE